LATKGEFLATDVKSFGEDCVCGFVEDDAAQFCSFMLVRVQRLSPRSYRSVFPGTPSSPIHFSPRPIAFTLDSSESPQRHAPETMAGA